MKKQAVLSPTRRAETELLLCCARIRMDPAKAAALKNLDGNLLDWDFIIDCSRHHRIMPLLYQNLAAVCPDRVPQAVLERLSRLYRENEIRNHRLAAELVRILNMLESHRIPAVPFKGPALALELYQNLALRQCDDLDLLVRQEDVATVERHLISRGYVPELNLSAEARAACLDIHDEYSYRRINPEFTVEIHWRLLPKAYSIPFDMSFLFESGAAPLPRETLLLILCLHGYMHRWQRLCWLSDISELVQGCAGIGWDSLLRQATILGCRRMVLLALCLVHTLFEIRLPESVSLAIDKDKAVHKICVEIIEGMFRKTSFSVGWFSLARFQARARENVPDRIRFWYRSALSPTALDYLYLRLPSSLVFLYPLLRPFRLAQKLLHHSCRICGYPRNSPI